jgi:sugar/nucleoside kinase (ribokinase family)
MSELDLAAIVDRFPEAKVLIIGDLWLEHRGVGAATADVHAKLKVRTAEWTTRAGGAGALACAVAAMGARAWVAGVVGQDARAGELLRALGAWSVDTFAVVSDPDHNTGENLALRLEGASAPWSALEIGIYAASSLALERAQEMLGHIEAIIAQMDLVAILPPESAPPGVPERLARLAGARGKPVLGVAAAAGAEGGGAAALPPCDVVVLGPPERNEACAGDDVARGLVTKMGHKALIAISPDWGVTLFQEETLDSELIVGPSCAGRGAWESFLAGAAISVALGANPLAAARIGAAAAIAAAASDGFVTLDEIRRELARQTNGGRASGEAEAP